MTRDPSWSESYIRTCQVKIAAFAVCGLLLLNVSGATAQSVTGEESPPPVPAYDEGLEQPDYSGDPTEQEAYVPPPQTDLPPQDTSPPEDKLQPGELFHTRFSGTTDVQDESNKTTTVLDPNGIVGSAIDVSNPGHPPRGDHWINEPQRMFATAAETGQIFGIAIDDGDQPNIFVSATAAFGLHRTPDNAGWQFGMWGQDGGPGSIYRLGADTGYLPEKFTDVTLDGRTNTSASLGNIAYDRQHQQLFVSDLETGMIHRLSSVDGKDLGRFDHGANGRTRFLDAWTGQSMVLEPVSFDAQSAAQIANCQAGQFVSTPECWNLADFRRRIWGLGVRNGATSGKTRLYYAVWGSDAFGNDDWAQAGNDRRNAIWSVGLTANGAFDAADVRREFFLPAFFSQDAGDSDRAGNSNPVSDITFETCGTQDIMIVAERGGMRNLGLGEPNAFARPHESRILRYSLASDGVWRPQGRYDVGFYARTMEGDPLVHANSAGGATFNYGYGEEGTIDWRKLGGELWMTGDALCSPRGACFNPATGQRDDTTEVHGPQGSPAASFRTDDTDSQPMPVTMPMAPGGSLGQSYMIDSDLNVDTTGVPVEGDAARNDATRIGDVEAFQICQAPAQPLPAIIPPPPPALTPEFAPPPSVPVHARALSHRRYASRLHDADRSWHRRNRSWHSRAQSWHWRDRSWHRRSRSWHMRDGSWHRRDRTWHYRRGSWHSVNKSWHWRNRSWHAKKRSWHLRGRSLHDRNRSWHNRNRSWHAKNRSWHSFTRSRQVPTHVKGRSRHRKGISWGQVKPSHVKGRSLHRRGISWRRIRKDDRRQQIERRQRRQQQIQRQQRRKQQIQRQQRRKQQIQRKQRRQQQIERRQLRQQQIQRQQRRKQQIQRQQRRKQQIQRQQRRKQQIERRQLRQQQIQRQQRRQQQIQRQPRRKQQIQRQPRRKQQIQRQQRRQQQIQRQLRRKQQIQRQPRRKQQIQRQQRRQQQIQRQQRRQQQIKRQPRRKQQIQRQQRRQQQIQRQQRRQQQIKRQPRRKQQIKREQRRQQQQ